MVFVTSQVRGIPRARKWCHQLPLLVVESSRYYSTVLSPPHARHKVQLPVAASGFIDLEILEPSGLGAKNILAYLPPGPFFPSSSAALVPTAPAKHASTIPLFLASFLPTTTIISLNYRLSPLPSPHTFPLPVFDTLKAFDYIASPHSPHNTGQHPRLSLYGSHIGGLLATTLALTESKAIHALAVSEPLADWVSLDDKNENEQENNTKKNSPAKKRRTKQPLPTTTATTSPPDPTRLLSIRSKLFRSPETYFDPFASPIFFLRAPGRDCPNENPDPLLASSAFSRSPSPASEAFGPYDDNYDHLGTDSSTLSYQVQKRRKVLRRWPPNTTDSVLPPYTRVFVRDTQGGEAGVLRAQGEELVELMRRACCYGREKGIAEERVQVQKMADIPESEVEGIIGIREAALWLREKFRDD